MDDKLCTEIFLINLITYFPSREDDLVTMQKFLDGPEEDCLKLDLPEQFTIEVSEYNNTANPDSNLCIQDDENL
jgi:hypothetical protein